MTGTRLDLAYIADYLSGVLDKPSNINQISTEDQVADVPTQPLDRVQLNILNERMRFSLFFVCFADIAIKRKCDKNSLSNVF